MKMEVIENGKAVPKNMQSAVLIAASDRFRARQLERYNARRQSVRPPEPNDDTSMSRLVSSVEARIVEAVWTERRLPSGGSGGRCGISYLHERAEIFANAVAAGDWQRPHPGSPPPKAIDRMHEPLSWLGWLPRDLASIVRAAALSKEGDQNANVTWGFVRRQTAAALDLTVRTLQRRYDAGLRAIAMRLAIG